MDMEFTRNGYDIWISDHWSETGHGYLASIDNSYTYYPNRLLPKDEEEAWQWASKAIENWDEWHETPRNKEIKASLLRKIALKIPYISAWTWKGLEGFLNSVHKGLIGNQEFISKNDNIDHQVLSNYKNILLGYKNNLSKAEESINILNSLIETVEQRLNSKNVKENIYGDRKYEFKEEEMKTKPAINVMEDKYRIINESIQSISDELEEIYEQAQKMYIKYDRKALENKQQRVIVLGNELEEARDYLVHNIKSGLGYGNVMANFNTVNQFKNSLLRYFTERLNES